MNPRVEHAVERMKATWHAAAEDVTPHDSPVIESAEPPRSVDAEAMARERERVIQAHGTLGHEGGEEDVGEA
jgi:hypothetical protein